MKLADITTLSEISSHYPTEKDVIHMLMDEGILVNSAICEKCTSQMKLRSRGDSYEWRCRVGKKDCSSRSIKSGSFFTKTKLTLTQTVKVFVMWTGKFSSGQIAKEVGVSKQTVCDWRNFLRDLCVEVEKGYGKVGGQGNIVEIDETNIHSRKYGVGKGTNDDWICGGVDRSSGKIFAKRVPNRTAGTLVPLLQVHIDKNSIVYSDEWRSYSQLKKYFVGHYTVQHKKQFVNLIGTRKICTNGIEAVWSRMKKPFKVSNGTSSALLDSYISEFVVRENEGADFNQRIIDAMKTRL